MDFDLLHILSTRNNYYRFKPHIKEWVLSKHATTIFNSMDGYYTTYPEAALIDWSQFEAHFFVLRNTKLRPDEAENYRTIFQKLRETGPTKGADELLTHYITADYAAQIADTAIKVAEGESKVSMSDVEKLFTGYTKEVGRSITKTDLFTPTDVATVVDEVAAGGLEWRLEELNISAGPLRQGDFVILGARPETGKTTFLADQVSYMAMQIKDGRPVIWVNNEERSNKVMFRIIQSALGLTVKDIISDQSAAMAEYTRLMGGNKDKIQVTNESAGLNSVDALIALFKELNPALIVFDQLDKVAGFYNEDRDDLRLGAVYSWARDLAHEYGPVIAASQADGSAEGQKWIYQHQLRGSKVDKPGEADLIITIGKTHDPSEENNRYIHLAKNKLFGGPRTDPTQRHGYWEVTINAEVARYVGTR
jgi:replicative DNA helicase